MQTHVALLRAINVGGHRIIPMKDLKTLCERRGLEGVRTYLQSGNVVFRSPLAAPALRTLLQSAIEEKFGFDVTVVLRSAQDMQRIAAENPFFQAPPEDPKFYHAVFLADPPAPEALAALVPPPGEPARFVAGPRELFLHYPQGAGKTKLTTDFLERRLGVRTTARNWNTVIALAELTAAG